MSEYSKNGLQPEARANTCAQLRLAGFQGQEITGVFAQKLDVPARQLLGSGQTLEDSG
jgi:hypothetical protein